MEPMVFTSCRSFHDVEKVTAGNDSRREQGQVELFNFLYLRATTTNPDMIETEVLGKCPG